MEAETEKRRFGRRVSPEGGRSRGRDRTQNSSIDRDIISYGDDRLIAMGMIEEEVQSIREIEFSCTNAQERAIIHETTPNSLLNIVSGPGTGKTKTLCHRIACLLSRGIKPSEIVVFSLTNQSVNDFRKSLATVIGEDLTACIQICTIHSYANSLILHRSPYWDIIRDEKNMDSRTMNPIIDQISAYKNEQIRKLHHDLRDIHTLPQISSKQLKFLKTNNVNLYRKYLHVAYSDKYVKTRDPNLIFDKMVLEATIIVWINNHVLKAGDASDIIVPRGFEIPNAPLNLKEIVVDEFQDLSGLLLDFVLELSYDKQLTIAGDIDQSLYGFNDATPDKNIKHIVQLYKAENHDLQEVVLDRTFRFGEPIHKLSLNLLAAKDSCIKEVVDEPSIPVVRETFTNLGDEFEFVYNEIHKLIEKSNGVLKPSSFAVLASVNRVLDDFQLYFQNKKSSFKAKRHTGNHPWMDTKLSSVVSFLKVLENPHNDPSMLVILSFAKNFGFATTLAIKEKAEKGNVSIFDFMHEDKRILKKFGLENMEKFDNIIANVNRKDPASIIYSLAELCELFAFSKRLTPDSNFDRFKDFLRELYTNLNVISKIEGPDMDVLTYFISNYQNEFLQESELDRYSLDAPSEYVTLSTIHSAKGLEWDIVFVISGLSDASSERYTQNSRVNYVAATRAKHLLYYNKSAFDDTLYVDTSDEKITAQSHVKVNYEKTIVDYIPELKPLTIPNKLTTLPQYGKPVSSQESQLLPTLLANIMGRSRNLRQGKPLGVVASKGISRMARLL